MPDLKVFIGKGVSCSGKSTYLKRLSRQENAALLSSDDIGMRINDGSRLNGPEVFGEIEKQGMQLREKGKSIIIDLTNLTLKKNRRWSQLADRFGADKICVFVNPSDHALERQRRL